MCSLKFRKEGGGWGPGVCVGALCVLLSVFWRGRFSVMSNPPKKIYICDQNMLTKTKPLDANVDYFTKKKASQVRSHDSPSLRTVYCAPISTVDTNHANSTTSPVPSPPIFPPSSPVPSTFPFFPITYRGSNLRAATPPSRIQPTSQS